MSPGITIWRQAPMSGFHPAWSINRTESAFSPTPSLLSSALFSILKVQSSSCITPNNANAIRRFLVMTS